MIDIHTHILPGVDDGAKNIDVSLALLRQEKDAGVTTVYLTPHNNKNKKTGQALRKRFQSFLLSAKDVGVNLKLGSEIYYYDGVIKDLKEGNVLTMDDTKYVLIEFSTRTETNIGDVVYELVREGYIPIVAHIERYPYLSREDWHEIKDNGGMIQVNASSLTHLSIRRSLKYLFKNDMVDYIGSDCHDADIRNVDFKFAKEYLKKRYPKEYVKLFERETI